MVEVVLGLIVRDDLILLGLRSPARNVRPGCWDLIGGHVEAGESLQEALARELIEEIGVRPLSYERIAVLTAGDPGQNATFHVFKVDRFDREPSILDSEHAALQWFSARDACELPNLASEHYIGLFRRVGVSSTAP
jgi:8-oxo-dGTP pyrophosphatase MutT (NUDIX family)